jgi:hypothetical protein
MCLMLTCDPLDHQHNQNQNIQQDQVMSPWDTIIQALGCEPNIEEFVSQPGGVIPSVTLESGHTCKR